MYTIVLSDGRKITNLGKNGDNFVSKKHIDERIFNGNLSNMTVYDDETYTVYNNVEFIQQVQYGNEWYLAFREYTDEELRSIEINSKIEYIAMMANIDMEV